MKKRLSRRMRKMLLMVASMALVLGLAIGGTIAWLTDVTAPVTNTFTPSDIEITLTETANQDDGTWKAQIIPGKTYAKDPVVAVDGAKTNVDVYLFVKFTEGDSANYLTYNSLLNEDNDWTPVEGQTNVWWREVKTNDATKSWNLLGGIDGFADGYVTVKDSVTTENMAAAAASKLEYKAYAIQTVGFDDADDAWAEVSKLG